MDTPTEGTARGTDRLTPLAIERWLKKHRAGRVQPHAKLSDGGGMYLTLTAAKTPVWRVKYRHDGKESTFSIGPYPGVSLSEARAERQRVKADLREGKNPMQARDVREAATVDAGKATFEAVARDWLRKQRKEWSAVHFEKSERAIERDALPTFGHLPVSEVTPKMVTEAVEAIATRGAVDTANKVRQHIGGIFRLAQARGLCDYKENPADAAREVLPKRARVKRRPAFLKWPDLGDVLRKAEGARLSPAVKVANRLLAFTAARISNVVQAEWSEFQLDAEPALWLIPRAKMKAQDREHDHKIILGPTIAAELREWRKQATGRGYVFPSPAVEKQGRGHITREALEKVYRRTLGLEDRHTPHGWRSSFSTLARDEGGFEHDAIELTLDHIHASAVVRAYDRGERLAQRIKLMKWWDGQLVSAQRGADVVPIVSRAARP